MSSLVNPSLAVEGGLVACSPAVPIRADRGGRRTWRRRMARTKPGRPASAASVAVAAPAIPSFEEIALRRRAIALVGDHWCELYSTLVRWLGQAYREDDSLPGEVGLVLMRRYLNGNGSLVAHLRCGTCSSADDDRIALFGEARRVYREVLPGAIERRNRVRADIQLDAIEASQLRNDQIAAFDFVEDDPRWAPAAKAEPIELDLGRVEQFLEAVEVLLQRGDQAWASLCDEGVLKRGEWTEDQKWTAIAMMWEFTVDQTAVIRQVKARNPGSFVVNRAATRKMMSRVRRKARVVLDAMSTTYRREHDLLGRGRQEGIH